MRISDWSSDVCSSDLYASVSYVDAMIGKVLNALREEGLDQNTIIIVWGDHGWQLGDHGIWGKHTLFDQSLKSTYIMKLPGHKQQGRVIDEVVSAVDVYPTLMELCGLAMPRSAERRLGKECVSTCRSRWSQDVLKKK